MTEQTSGASYGEALRSTAIVGGSSAIMLLIRMVRTKVLAVLLGPAGVGLEALFDSLINLARSISGFGVNTAGVRQIAAAAGTNDENVIAVTVSTLRWVCRILGLAGTLAVFALREPLSRVTFGSDEYSTQVAILAVILLFSAVNAGQGALLQGLRRIRELAKINIVGAALALLVTLPIVYLWGRGGIPVYMVLSSAVSMLVAWVYTRRVHVSRDAFAVSRLVLEVRRLMKYAIMFLLSEIMALGVTYIIRVLIVRGHGIEAAGQFQAANSVSALYVGFILQAMGADFYPRLTAVATDNKRCNQFVNEQAEVSLLLALPGVLATFTFAPWVISIFYSDHFDVATDIMRWQLAGMVLRIISWPMAFILVAKGHARTFLFSELVASSFYTLLAWLGLLLFGLPGAGMAFLGLYILYVIVTYILVRRASGFAWSSQNLRLTLIGISGVTIALITQHSLSLVWATATNFVVTLVVGFHCLKMLAVLTGTTSIAGAIRQLRALRPARTRACPPE